MSNKIREEIQKVSSYQYKCNLITSSICCAIGLIVFISFSIYEFCTARIWWLGLIPLGIALLIGFMFGFCIAWLVKRYKYALAREKKEQENKIKEDNIETENSL